MQKFHSCPICKQETPYYERYPKMVCLNCKELTTDKNGRKVQFFNENMFGGCVGFYANSEEPYNSMICYINGIECKADDGRFGGIVIEVRK